MNLQERVKKRSKTMEVFATAGTIGMHMVSGPIVGFGIGYVLDKWLGTDPWMKLIFFLVGIGAGFLNVHRDSQHLLRKMQKEKEAQQAALLETVRNVSASDVAADTGAKCSVSVQEDKQTGTTHEAQEQEVKHV